jgi:hypothetical protein
LPQQVLQAVLVVALDPYHAATLGHRLDLLLVAWALLVLVVATSLNHCHAAMQELLRYRRLVQVSDLHLAHAERSALHSLGSQLLANLVGCWFLHADRIRLPIDWQIEATPECRMGGSLRVRLGHLPM